MTETANYAERMDLVNDKPHGELSSTGYMLANPGAQYLAFAPNGGSFTVNLSAGSGSSFSAEWLNVYTADVVIGDSVDGGSSSVKFTPPFSGAAVLFLNKLSGVTVSIGLVSDTGSSATDKITSNPAIKGTGQASTVVTIKEGSTTLGTTTADSTGAWSFTPAGLAEGTHTLAATQTDLAGNTGTATLSFMLDRVPPAVSMALVSDTGSSATDKITSNPAIKGTGQASTVVTIKEGSTTLGTTTADGTGVWSYTPTGFVDGVHTLSAFQTDPAGNTGTATLSFTLAKTAPTVSIALVSDTGSSATDKITSNPAIKGTGQASTVVTIKEGSTTLGTTTADSTGAWSFTPTGLADGAHTLTATPDRPGRQYRDGNAELHARQDAARSEHGSGLGHWQLGNRQDHLEPGDQGHRSGQYGRNDQRRQHHARHDDSRRHGRLELHADRPRRWRAHAVRFPDRSGRQYRHGNAELYAR